jgi:hypothetical protein
VASEMKPEPGDTLHHHSRTQPPRRLLLALAASAVLVLLDGVTLLGGPLRPGGPFSQPTALLTAALDTL